MKSKLIDSMEEFIEALSKTTARASTAVFEGRKGKVPPGDTVKKHPFVLIENDSFF